MGTTLYELRRSNVTYLERLQQCDNDPNDEAFILAVTVKLTSPWHALHSLVPAYNQVHLDSRYGFLGQNRTPTLVLVDQDLAKDKHIWDPILNRDLGEEQAESFGALYSLLSLVSNSTVEIFGSMQGFRCYRRAVWGHELMLYSGGGWTTPSHFNAFRKASQAFFAPCLSGTGPDGIESTELLIVERRTATAWGRLIDNMQDAITVAQEWVGASPNRKIHVIDFAELSVVEQLRIAFSVKIFFGAHGDGLTWAMFMQNGALLEAVPKRKGYETCAEGIDLNPRGIFGGIAKLSGQIHICWLNEALTQHREADDGKLRPTSTLDFFDWGWRQNNLNLDLDKFARYLQIAAQLVETGEREPQIGE
eukprot:gnl/MRDRNA2_/MRDRNA2_163512_c0_seq1.p1 gnl/MRDRNA2_/MRDRNA2_163512_c0~~gnl/MRDRNA2_/MRDRNA2_163512_c0_seq1.p1  ORF type:complete len:363 (+),score=60.44 gnl/MRDRNA2_/MRDRNA2_163512_c0_seq1:3-1091(+)